FYAKRRSRYARKSGRVYEGEGKAARIYDDQRHQLYVRYLRRPRKSLRRRVGVVLCFRTCRIAGWSDFLDADYRRQIYFARQYGRRKVGRQVYCGRRRRLERHLRNRRERQARKESGNDGAQRRADGIYGPLLLSADGNGGEGSSPPNRYPK